MIGGTDGNTDTIATAIALIAIHAAMCVAGAALRAAVVGWGARGPPRG